MTITNQWVRTGSRTRTGGASFDVAEDMNLAALCDDIADHTPLDFDNIPDVALGAVLKDWDDTLCTRVQRPNLRFYGGLTPRTKAR